MTTPMESSFSDFTVTFTRQSCGCSGSQVPSYNCNLCEARNSWVCVIAKDIEKPPTGNQPNGVVPFILMRRYFPNFSAFSDAAKTAQIVPVYRQLLSDRLTPVGAFDLLEKEDYAFLLESVVGGEKIARYSFIAAGPRTVYQVSGGKPSLQHIGQ